MDENEPPTLSADYLSGLVAEVIRSPETAAFVFVALTEDGEEVGTASLNEGVQNVEKAEEWAHKQVEAIGGTGVKNADLEDFANNDS